MVVHTYQPLSLDRGAYRNDASGPYLLYEIPGKEPYGNDGKVAQQDGLVVVECKSLDASF